MSRVAIAGLSAVVLGFLGCAFLVGGWFLAAAGAPAGSCGNELDQRAVPAELVPLFRDAATSYALGTEGSAILAGLTSVESGLGRHLGPSSAGALGWTQFMPATWQRFGID